MDNGSTTIRISGEDGRFSGELIVSSVLMSFDERISESLTTSLIIKGEDLSVVRTDLLFNNNSLHLSLHDSECDQEAVLVFGNIFSMQPSELILKDIFIHKEVSIGQYYSLKKMGLIEKKVWYYVFADSKLEELVKIYYGDLLFAMKGEQVQRGFPYIFPLTFVS